MFYQGSEASASHDSGEVEASLPKVDIRNTSDQFNLTGY